MPCSDRAELAAECAEAGILVLGPDAAAIRAIGTPAGLAEVAAAAGVPVPATPCGMPWGPSGRWGSAR